MNTIAQVINQLRDVARRSVPATGRVLLDGSHARGDWHEGSDWDVLILLDQPEINKNDYDNIVFPFTYLGWTLGESIVPVIYTQSEWESHRFLPFNQHVEHDKIILK